MKYQDYYKTLGVERTATADEISKAYRKLARKFHPDVNKGKGAEEKFKELTEAYEVLKDPEKRTQYDALGENWRSGQEFRPPPGWENIFSGGARGQRSGATFSFGGAGGGGFSDFFDMLFGGAAGASTAGQFKSDSGMEDLFGRRGQSAQGAQQASPKVAGDITIALEEAYRGGTKSIALTYTEPNGRGAPKKTDRTYQVKIPAGIRDGSVIRLAGQGGKGSGSGPAGDLLLRVHIAPHPHFRIDHANLRTTLAITPWEGALGTKAEVPTLDGPVSMTIPPGSQSGSVLRLKGKGLPQKGSTHGDLLVELKIVVPRELSAGERELFEKLKQVSSFNPRS